MATTHAQQNSSPAPRETSSPEPFATVAVPQISITPLLGVNLARVFSLIPPATGTGPATPTDAAQLGMTPGKIVQGSDGIRYILGENPTGGAQVAAGAAANLDSANGFKVTASAPSATVFAASAVNLMPVSARGWFKLTAPIP